MFVCLLVAVAWGTPAVAGGAAEGAGVPVDGGRIDLGAGVRVGEAAGPFGTARFAWQMSRTFSLGIDLGYQYLPPAERYQSITVFDLRLSLAWHGPRLGPFFPYLLGGMGQHLVGVTRSDGAYVEVTPTGLHAGAGAWLPLGDRYGLFLEGRFGYAVIDGAVLGQAAPVNVTGLQIVLGVVVTFPAEPPLSR
ncbi:MAG: hypothetical protein D6729_10165 [Deltaproteobacteria bacterium]|nr:MAG: hypothetical protein D6729_10165 [Deltaproteobacteria bacterium]